MNRAFLRELAFHFPHMRGISFPENRDTMQCTNDTQCNGATFISHAMHEIKLEFIWWQKTSEHQFGTRILLCDKSYLGHIHLSMDCAFLKGIT